MVILLTKGYEVEQTHYWLAFVIQNLHFVKIVHLSDAFVSFTSVDNDDLLDIAPMGEVEDL